MLVTLLTFGIHFIEIFTTLLMWCLFIWVIMRWVSSTQSPIGNALDNIIKPILKPFRWAKIGMFDLSPIIVFYLLNFISSQLVTSLTQYIGTL